LASGEKWIRHEVNFLSRTQWLRMAEILLLDT
jgi:hypothetical protein